MMLKAPNRELQTLIVLWNIWWKLQISEVLSVCVKSREQKFSSKFFWPKFFEPPLGSWTSAPSGHGGPHRNACFSRTEGLTKVFAPGRPPGFPRGRPPDIRPKTYSLGCFFVSLRSCRSSSVNFFWFFVGKFGKFNGKFGGNFRDFFWPTEQRLKNFGENFGAFFVRKFVARKKSSVQNSLCRRAALTFSFLKKPPDAMPKKFSLHIPCSAQICQIKFLGVQTWHWHWHLIQIRSFPE